MDTLMQLVTKGNDFLWSFLLLVLLCGTGLYYTIRLRFIQVRKFGEGVRQVFGHFSMNGEKHEKGEMTPFQSIATAIAAQVGTGNLAGAATALIGGGPGAIFWMWVSAFLGMATIYGEAVLAQTYKTEVNGEVTGGPVYYIKAAFKGTFGKALSTLFAVFIILALGFMGNMVQSNSIGAAFVEAFQVFHVELSPVIVGIVVAVIAAVIFLGGTKSLATVVEKIVPIMAGVYIVGSLVLICMNITALPAAFLSIIEGAFAPEAVLGAGAGITVREAIRYGVARGLFSNEAGMGSTPHAHARAKAESPHHQGLCAMVSVFIDTFIVLNLTVFSVLTTGVMSSRKGRYRAHSGGIHEGLRQRGDHLRCSLPVLLRVLHDLKLAFLRTCEREVFIRREGIKALFADRCCLHRDRFLPEAGACMVLSGLLQRAYGHSECSGASGAQRTGSGSFEGKIGSGQASREYHIYN